MSAPPSSRSVEERLGAWVDDVQVSARVGFPHYKNPAELKADIRELLTALADLRALAERGQRIEVEVRQVLRHGRLGEDSRRHLNRALGEA